MKCGGCQPIFLRWPLRLAAASLPGLLLSGCVTVEMFKSNLAYDPVRLGSRVEARVSLDVAHSISPEARDVWRSWGNGPETMGNWELAVREVIVDDLVGSGLFAGAQVGGVGGFDYLVRVRSQDLRGPDRFRVELQVCDWATRDVIGAYQHETAVENGKFDNVKSAIQTALAQVKADVLADAEKGKFPLRGSGMTIPQPAVLAPGAMPVIPAYPAESPPPI